MYDFLVKERKNHVKYHPILGYNFIAEQQLAGMWVWVKSNSISTHYGACRYPEPRPVCSPRKCISSYVPNSLPRSAHAEAPTLRGGLRWFAPVRQKLKGCDVSPTISRWRYAQNWAWANRDRSLMGSESVASINMQDSPYLQRTYLLTRLR